MARGRASFLPLLIFPLLVSIHLFIAPYTKVEESFNIQAAHDILQYGVPVGDRASLRFKTLFDHMTFPGAVPRTFIGSIVLATAAKPLAWLMELHNGDSLQMLGELISTDSWPSQR
jgi:alpha-1,6-mannosyltransferase